jgi:hypothetical protein
MLTHNRQRFYYYNQTTGKMADEIFNIKIEGFDTATQDIVRLETELKKLNEERKKAMTVGQNEKDLTEEQSKKAAELTGTIAKLTQQKNDANKTLKAGTTLLNEQKGAYSKLSTQLNEARNRYKDLAAAGKQNTTEGKALLANVNSLDKQLKGIDATVGQHQRNVGNYSSALQGLGVPMGGVNKLIAVQTMLQGQLTRATAGTSSMMKILKIALISTGIGAIVVAVGALSAAFLSTQRGVNALNSVLIPLRVVFERLWGIVQELATGLVDAFKKPQELIAGFLNFIKNPLQGIKNLVDDTKEAFAGLKEEIKQAADEGKQLADIKVQLALIGIEIAKNEGRLNRQFEEQKAIMMDVNKSDEERKKAGEAALAAARELTDMRQTELDLKIEQMQLETKQNDTNYEKQKELAELIAQRDQLEADNLKETTRLRNTLNGITKASLDAQKKEAETLAANLQKIRDEIINAQQDLKPVDPGEDEAFTKFMEGVTKQTDAEIAARKAALDEIAQYRTETIFEALDREQAHIDQLLAQGLINEMDHAQASKVIQADRWGTQVELAQSILGQIGELLGKETKAGKLAASAATAINTYQSIMKTLAVYGWTPLGIAGMAATAAMGIKQIAQINKTPDKFAQGGIIGGNSHAAGGTTFVGSDGSAFEAERGELLAIVNKRDTELIGQLGAINGIHGRKFAAGGIVQPQVPESMSAVQQLAAQIQNQRVYVLESDITKKQKHVRVIESAGEL